jgi:hypothetical protein
MKRKVIEAPRQFIERYIRREMRERVAHEWEKKPDRLKWRASHASAEIFEDRFKSEALSMNDEETCYVLKGVGEIREMSFSEAKKYIRDPMGILVVTTDGSKFYARSEYHHGIPTETYSSG